MTTGYYVHWETGDRLPYWFGGWIQAKFATLVSATPIDQYTDFASTARIDYLAAGRWVNWGGAGGVWGDG